ncbi:DNA repair protein RecN [Paraburkholderia fungorum]|jgi:DNA repair protein RecN (Recombination protein N)|uniref:DNA repair protein RecN n=1 Tax=Paraburkholderia fungorum TaxID=134537 RepID=A0AAP1L2M1_9BURK|nr:DNA repair protein RecN [Paraburkholderia fungorum]MBB4518008.1 DNA repair protein RecN (Recombination protein N) [Paraburkholderia fungorum]MBB6205978.1 DNA repair protein RecN (Recombination protein N) [Paraburkholderia fungorum]MDT8838122.1 DNA repair protein RecN [Paraburkholderia fungorum]PRZ50651.1 DNA replication and repair protein RecN [Paraburkholderia fungorum]USU16880.1 DNA repair protein RecN [Paraburkholderia fungorum]
MLRHLSIRDFVIVAALDLEFDSGFTVFSGETGAGKSILIDALALALGARADASVVRTGESRADITAEFDTHAQVEQWLDEQALGAPVDDAHQGTVMLRRVVDTNGRSRAFINGTAATLTQLREVGEMLVDIHGQHAHQLLMRPDAQRELFDTHAGLTETAATVSRAWRAWREKVQAVEHAQTRDRELQLERERLAWQLTELDKLSPQPGEWEEVNSEHRRLSHSANLIDGVQGALSALSESDEAMITHLASIVSKVRDLAEIDPALNDVLAALEPAEIQLQEAAYSLSHYAQKLELDPDRLAQVEKRLDALHSAARKFRLQPETLPQEHEARRAQLAALDAAADLDSLHAVEAKAKEAFLTEAKKLSKARAKAGKALGAAVTTGMQELSMKGGSFEVALVQLPEGGAHGLEQVEFRVAGHAGVPLRPLAKVASGGELARISLALAVIASAASPTPTLIFDEVDTGIGGGVAEVVGRLLHQLGQARQVLCVTHLPQVAARGDHHFQVAKSGNGKGGTVSSVTPLDRASRVEEVARMLGGLEITATTRKHAKEMLAA